MLRKSQNKRGSVVMLVIAVLAILALLGITMSFSSKVDLQASRNYGNLVQARMATATGIPVFQATAPNTDLSPLRAAGAAGDGFEELEPVALGIRYGEPRPIGGAQDAALSGGLNDGANTGVPSFASITQGDGGVGAEAIAQPQFADAAEALNMVTVQDNAARINLNALTPLNAEIALRRTPATPAHAQGLPTPDQPSLDMLTSLIRSVAAHHQLEGINANLIAYQILNYRLGVDGRPGVAGFDDNFNGNQVMARRPDGIDNDKDGLIDEADELKPPMQRDGLDNNRDGVIDDAGESLLSDGLDNDYDGQIDNGGEGVDDHGELVNDLREKPNGDDRHFHSIDELKALRGMTPELFKALRPLLTEHSVSFAAWKMNERGENGEALGWPQVDPNNAPAGIIAQSLEKRFPGAPAALIGQFTANIIDRRDLDDTPSEVEHRGMKYYGIEITPVINEVCPDVISFDDQGDDGQFVELHNPWSKPIDLDGWRLTGAGPAIGLSGSIPAGGYWVFTDDFNNAQDPDGGDEPAGMGSFYDVFGKVGAGQDRRVLEIPTLDLANQSGDVKLYNRAGELVDEFSYRDGIWDGAPMSLQRIDPRVRTTQKALATPLAPNIDAKTDAADRKLLEITEAIHNTPFRSALDLMLVNSGYVDTGAGGRLEAQAWQMPEPHAGNSRNLDLRLIDCFHVGAVVEPRRNAVVAQVFDELGYAVAAERIERPRVAVRHGAININTASPAVLSSLPEIRPSLLFSLLRARAHTVMDLVEEQEVISFMDDINPMLSTEWANLSDFLTDDRIWEGVDLYDRLDQVAPFYRLLTTHTESVTVRTLNRSNGEALANEQDERRQTYIMAERVLSADRGHMETVRFRYLRSTDMAQDSDLRYAVAESSARGVLRLKDLVDINPLNDPSYGPVSPLVAAIFGGEKTDEASQ